MFLMMYFLQILRSPERLEEVGRGLGGGGQGDLLQPGDGGHLPLPHEVRPLPHGLPHLQVQDRQHQPGHDQDEVRRNRRHLRRQRQEHHPGLQRGSRPDTRSREILEKSSSSFKRRWELL